MAYTPITGAPNQYLTEDNELASGYYLKFYQANTTTPLSVATDDTGGTLLAKVKLNARGMPISNPLDNDTVFIPHVDQSYRIVLYKTEADADADNTANSDFNIPDVSPDIAPSGDAADITLRSTTVEAQDDYDRSPLFVDGTDFTAGVGPHTITVPATWDPTDSTFRVYRLDASDIVTALSPTTTTSTTFTIQETLLSTDVVYIGDDEFRNVHDGDPADIRARLGEFTTENLADGILSPDTTGRAKMADGFVTTAKLLNGLLTADATGRAKMANEFTTTIKLESAERMNTANVTLAIAGASGGAVGTYGFFWTPTDTSARAVGYVAAGSQLEWAGADNQTIYTGANPSGSWMLVGHKPVERVITTWLRVS